MKLKNVLIVFCVLAFALACGLPSAAPATVTATAAAPTPLPATATTVAFTPIPGVTSTTVSGPQPPAFCSDPAVSALLASFKSVMLGSDGAGFASLVSPSHGLDVRNFRYVEPVNYDQEHAEFVFETTFVINWGPQPGSGEDLHGSFQDVIIPSLQDVLGAAATTNVCNQIRTGGATYVAEWPYPGIDYYSIHFPGTDAYGGLDWETWLTGVHYADGQPYLYALVHLDWEP
jgi:hypothetical protein